ncbi:MAG: adenylate/guanylate cyclase domain-containing protein [Actinomycetota bacterium]
MSQVTRDHLEAGREAYERHAWAEALEELHAADAERALDPPDLVVLAQAAWFGGDPDAAIEARERAYAAYAEEGEECKAAEMALQLASDRFDRLETAIGAGWLSRAGRLLDGMDRECPAHGWQAVMFAFRALRVTGDLEEVLTQARRAHEVGARLKNSALKAFGLQLQGMSHVAAGRVQEGMSFIDEATVAAVGGELDPYTTGAIYCMTIGVCREMADWRRAGEWTDAAERWCERTGISGFPGICRVHRAEVMYFRGAWADAEREAKRACEELRKYDLTFSARGLYEVGEIRLRVGDLPGAADAFRQSHDLNWDPEPGMSLLRLAQGDVEGARVSITRALANDQTSPLMRFRLLAPAVDIGLAAGDLEGVRQIVDELETTADIYETPALLAAVASARGALLLAEGDPIAAAGSLHRAVELWNEAGAPYEVARARRVLGEAYRADGDESAAVVELETAKTAFERLGAVPDADRAAELLGKEAAVAIRSGARVTRTFMFTDIVGSTPLVEALGDEAWQDLIQWHDQTLRSLIERNGGGEVRHTGDGFFVSFENARAALDSAVAIQRALTEHRRAHGFAPQVRIGLHEAEVVRRGRDYAGKGVHEAARIGALAEGGEILVSRSTVGKGAVRFPLSEPRTVTLKGVSEPVEVVSVEWR